MRSEDKVATLFFAEFFGQVALRQAAEAVMAAPPKFPRDGIVFSRKAFGSPFRVHGVRVV